MMTVIGIISLVFLIIGIFGIMATTRKMPTEREVQEREREFQKRAARGPMGKTSKTCTEPDKCTCLDSRRNHSSSRV